MTSVTYDDFSGSAAENYERYFVPAIATPVSGALLEAAQLAEGQRVVDVACGTGVATRLAARQIGAGGSLTGVDVAPDMIEVARSVPVPGDATVDWVVADATDIPLPDAEADVVLCQMGLMFMPDRDAAVAEMARLLKPGGRLAVSTPGRIQPPFELMEQALVDHINPDLGGFVRAVFSMHDPDAVASLLRDAGLDGTDARETNATLELPGPAAFLWQYIHLTPMGAFVGSAPDDAKAALEQQVVETWAPHVEDGATPVDQPMVVATGVRWPSSPRHGRHRAN